MYRFAVWVALLVIFVPVVHAQERPTHFGVSLAYPVTLPQAYPMQKRWRHAAESVVGLTLDVDTSGVVRRISVPPATDSLFLEVFGSVIDSVRFEPGLVNGQRAEQVIPVLFHYNSLSRKFSFQFPVDTMMAISDPDLYFYAVGQNGIDLPGIDYFPSYFYKVSPADTPGVCQYVLAKVSLDSAGHLMSIAAVNNGPSSFAAQVLTAANWGKYRAARIQGRPVSCDAYLVMTFLPGIAYPTEPLFGGRPDLSLTDRLRVRLYPDTAGWMLRPFAVNPGYDGVYVMGKIRKFDTASVAIRVDTLGSVSFVRASGCLSGTYDAFADLFPGMRFVPAMDFSGHPHDWDGLLRIEYVDSTRIRIGYPWLPDVTFAGSR